MIHSPGTTRRCPEGIPEDVILRLALLNLRAMWVGGQGWMITATNAPERTIIVIPATAIEVDGWDLYLAWLVDRLIKPDTAQVQAVIFEENFDVEQT
jgi:hypothetical protein